MSIEENKEIIRRFYDAGNRGDVGGAMSLVADDVRWTNIGSTPFSGTFAGKADLADRLIGPLFGQLEAGITTHVDLMIAEDDFVVVLDRGEARTRSGKDYNNTYCHVFQLRDGLICAVTEYFDTELARSVLTR